MLEFIPYQVCPKCNAESKEKSKKCWICNGNGIIPMNVKNTKEEVIKTVGDGKCVDCDFCSFGVNKTMRCSHPDTIEDIITSKDHSCDKFLARK